MLTVLPHTTQPRVRWKNGAGWTTEIAARPAPEFDWRLSVAEVDQDCDFSPFPGIDRTILVLTGPGMTLHVDGASPVHLTPNTRPHAFSGDHPARATVTAPTRDFNVMTRRGRYTHAVTPIHLDRTLTLTPPPNTTVALYLTTGHAAITDHRLAPGDCLLHEPVPSASLLTLHGEATLLRIDLTPT